MSKRTAVVDDYTKQLIADGAFRLHVKIDTGGGDGQQLSGLEVDFASFDSWAQATKDIGQAIKGGMSVVDAVQQVLGIKQVFT